VAFSGAPGKAWLRIGRKAVLRAAADRVDFSAASVAYYALLSLAPGLSALVAVYGVLGDPADVGRQLDIIRGVAPQGVVEVAREQLTRLTTAPGGALALSALLSVLVGLWGLNRGVDGFRTALIAMDRREGRKGVVRRAVRSLVLTVGALAVAVAALLLLAVAPAVQALVPGLAFMETLLGLVRWPVLLGAAAGYAAVLYRWGVNRRRRAWRHVLAPAGLAACAWLAVSYVLTLYVSGFASLSESYGSLAGAVVLLLWLFVSAYVFLLGAELSFVLEDEAKPQA
jgi:membrane protein